MTGPPERGGNAVGGWTLGRPLCHLARGSPRFLPGRATGGEFLAGDFARQAGGIRKGGSFRGSVRKCRDAVS